MKPRSIFPTVAPTALALCLSVVLLTGCLEFVEQAMTYRHDLKTDTLRILQDYRGIFAADKPEAPTADELGQLDSVLKTQRTFFFSNWILEYNREQLERDLAELDDPVKIRDKKLTPAAAVAMKQTLTLLLANVRVENAGLYQDAQGRLCGMQQVTVSNVSRIIAAANAFIPHLLRQSAEEEGKTAELAAVYRAAAGTKEKFITFEGNRFTIRWPVTRGEFDRETGAGGNSAREVAQFRKAGGRLEFKSDRMIWSVGQPSDFWTTLTLPMSRKEYAPNLLTAVKQRTALMNAEILRQAGTNFLHSSP